MPIEYPSTSPEGVATIFHVADWTDSNHAWKNVINKIVIFQLKKNIKLLIYYNLDTIFYRWWRNSFG